MNVTLLENERIDDLERSGLKIIQNTKDFCFGIDAVLLSGFAAQGMGNPSKEAQAKSGASVLDMCTGTGILPLLLSAKTDAAYITGMEIQQQSADMASRSVQLNDLEAKIRIVQGDIKEAATIFGRSVFDVVTCNPPYIKANSGIVNPASAKALARHEVACTFADVASQSAAVLKPGGRLFLVHRPNRLAEIIDTLRAHKLEPKRMRLVHSFADAEAVLVLIEAVQGGNTELKVEKPLIVYKAPGQYTDEIYQIYGF